MSDVIYNIRWIIHLYIYLWYGHTWLQNLHLQFKKLHLYKKAHIKAQ